jgi:recombinational DNA repair protein (RecF pathway)
MTVEVKGLIIRTVDIKETDRLVTISPRKAAL